MARETHALPVWLEPVLAFINTVDVEAGTDALAQGPAALSHWLGSGASATDDDAAALSHRPIPQAGPNTAADSPVAPAASGGAVPINVAGGGAVPVSRADYRLAIELRSGLRYLALLNNAGPADESETARMRRVLDQLPLVAQVGLDESLRPHGLPPARAALGVIVAGYARAVATGDWARIRRCPADDCAWAFWDSSAKGTRRWCTMRVCGNRAKARAFAQRKSRGQSDAHK